MHTSEYINKTPTRKIVFIFCLQLLFYFYNLHWIFLDLPHLHIFNGFSSLFLSYSAFKPHSLVDIYKIYTHHFLSFEIFVYRCVVALIVTIAMHSEEFMTAISVQNKICVGICIFICVQNMNYRTTSKTAAPLTLVMSVYMATSNGFFFYFLFSSFSLRYYSISCYRLHFKQGCDTFENIAYVKKKRW